MSTRIWIRRAYEPPTRNDGARILVDRVWPRGVTKDAAALTEWMRAVAPSNDLRRWFGHDPRRWAEFRRRYRAELRHDREAAAALVALVERARAGRVTLVYGAHDRDHNQAVVLREVVEERLARGR